MSTQEDLILEEMSRQSENPRKREQKVEVFAKSEHSAEKLKAEKGEKVWVKCVSHREPWTADQKLAFWKDYLIPVDEAIMLDERRFVVILIEKPILKEKASPAPKVK